MNKHAIRLQEQSTRKEILLLLKKRGSVSVQEMSEHLGVTRMSVRKHLYALEKDSYIQSSILRQHVGRPTYSYRLTVLSEELFPNEYDNLAMELIQGINDMFGESLVNSLFERRMAKIEKKHREAMSGQNFEKRVATLAKIQDQEGYMVKLEKKQDGTYLFDEVNCPVVEVAIRNRQACQCEVALFEALLDADVQRTECIADGNVRCRYLIKERGNY
ncbi:helix-turn-helix transcriptional regulator [Brevibacillus laterosporus]|uniref:helix-turn-helix transcriptional regulator n=1 Tax=Brevibacillus laterosporus TaxID=1465 RepID=UPI00265425A4|nr:metalloregulator ArsR/SmtB family transcription factor [Brevibacillus laterosporus]MDN9012698.1 transcriptional regulator [Brevibacillus laterosporus]MDO0943787.1 transcriptional regulator [Brevibacillus laterosporus]